MSAVYRNVYLTILYVIFLTNLFLLSSISFAISLFNLQTFVKETCIVSITFLCFAS